MKQLNKQNLTNISHISNSHQKCADSENWSQLRLPSGSLNSRSYHSISYYYKRIYVYGGYELHTGVKDDFFYFDYSAETLGIPTRVIAQNPQMSPGPLCRHSANQYKDNLIIYGGKKNAVENSNQIYIFDFIEEKWERKKPKIDDPQTANSLVPYLESHSSSIHEKSRKLYIFGGFEVKDGHLNKIHEYDLYQNSWKTLAVLGKTPCARSSHSSAIIHDYLYIFGGQNLNQRFGDFWQFNITTNTWLELALPNQPQARNGHSMCSYKENIILFGGIQGITREMNDLFCFSQEKQEWSCIEYETKYDRHDLAEEELLQQMQLDESSNNILTTSRNSPKIQFSEVNSILDELRLSAEPNHSKNLHGKVVPKYSSAKHLLEKQDFSSKLQDHQLHQYFGENTQILKLNEQEMFEDYIARQKALLQLQWKKQDKHPEFQTASMRLLKKQQLRNVFTQQYLYGFSTPQNRQSTNHNAQSPSFSSSHKNEYFQGDNSFASHVSNRFRADEMIEKINSSNCRSNPAEQSFGNSIKSMVRSNTNQNNLNSNQNMSMNSNCDDSDYHLHFQSFAARIKSHSQNPLKKGHLVESLNTIFDKIKRLSMNPLISKEEKYQQITDLRKKILLREFVEANATDRIRNHHIDTHHQGHGKSNSQQVSMKFIKTEPQEGLNNEVAHTNLSTVDTPVSRFPMLRSPTTDAMRKAIKQTESKVKNASDYQHQKEIMLNTSQKLQSIKQVKIENCRIKNIKPQPRDGHSAIIIDDFLVILGGDRHKLSFNDMFECNLKKALTNYSSQPFTSPARGDKKMILNQLNSPNKQGQSFFFNNNQIHS